VKNGSPRLAVRALRPILSGLRALHVDPAPLLARAGLPGPPVHDPDAHVPMAAVLALIAAAVEATGDQDLGLHLAERAELESVDAPFYAMRASATLGEAFARLCRYQRLIHETSRVEMVEDGAHVRLRHALAGGLAAPRQTAEFLLAIWLRSGREVTGVAWQPAGAWFAHAAPHDAREHRRVFGDGVRFASPENALVLERRALELPCTGADPALAALLDRFARDLIARQPRGSTFSDLVSEAVALELASGSVSAAAVARRLRTSVRTLNRLLKQEGVTYREVSESLRRQWAERKLAHGDEPIAQVAFDLGFRELSAFYRAFRRWTGLTPAQYRLQAASS